MIAAAVQAVLLLPGGGWQIVGGRRPAMIIGAVFSVSRHGAVGPGLQCLVVLLAMAVFRVSGAFLVRRPARSWVTSPDMGDPVARWSPSSRW